MKTTVEHNNKEQEIKYPFIGISENKEIVLFYEECKGTTLDSGEGLTSIEKYSESYVMRFFKPFKGKITLEND